MLILGRCSWRYSGGMKELITRYNTQGPRYTSYPPVPFWNKAPAAADWLAELAQCLAEDAAFDLYVHVPFCEQLCYYCGCSRVVTRDKTKGSQYVDLLLREWLLYRDRLGDLAGLRSLHLGGGTPTFLPPSDLARLLRALISQHRGDFTGAIEIDPRTVEREHLTVISDFGFTRVSLGIQDFDQEVQRLIHRHQPYALIESLLAQLRTVGTWHVNFDLIYGLPGQTIETVQRTLAQVIALRPDSIAFYSYAHLPNSLPNQRLIEEGRLPVADQKMDMLVCAQERLSGAGYVAVGMDHFALPGSFLAAKQLTRNFMGYTDKKSEILIGLGASAIGQSPGMYAQNTKSLADYTLALGEGRLPLMGGHTLNTGERVFQQKLQELFCEGKFELSTAEAQDTQLIARLAPLESDALLMRDGRSLRVSALGRKFLRNIAMAIDPLMQQTSPRKFSRTI